jgi:hypothetical protein
MQEILQSLLRWENKINDEVQYCIEQDLEKKRLFVAGADISNLLIFAESEEAEKTCWKRGKRYLIS